MVSPERPRLAVDLRALVGEPTGIGVYTRAVVLELARQGGFEILGLSHRPVSGGEELAAAGVVLHTRRAPRGVVWQQLHFARGARSAGASLLWSPITTLPWRATVPSVVTVPDLTALLFASAHRAQVRWSVRPFLRRTLRTARAVVAISRSTARDLERRYPWVAPKIQVIHCGVDPEFVPASPAAVAATRAELGAPHGYVLYAGTIEPRKNIGALLRAWEGLAEQAPERTPPLFLAGPYGWHSEDVLAAIQRLRDSGLSVRQLGRLDRPRLVRVVQAARVFAYPSLYEGFGLPPLEALACGVPVVASNASSLPEVVGEAGILVEPTDVAALGAALRQVLDEPEEAAVRRRAGGLRQAARFSWTAAASEHARVFREAIGAARGEPVDSR